jgi:hypothetical protein
MHGKTSLAGLPTSEVGHRCFMTVVQQLSTRIAGAKKGGRLRYSSVTRASEKNRVGPLGYAVRRWPCFLRWACAFACLEIHTAWTYIRLSLLPSLISTIFGVVHPTYRRDQESSKKLVDIEKSPELPSHCLRHLEQGQPFVPCFRFTLRTLSEDHKVFGSLEECGLEIR